MRTWVGTLATLCAGCASIHSTPLPSGETTADGLVYHLPRRDVVVKVTVAAVPAPARAGTTTEITAINVERGPAYADISRRFALGFERSAFADHSIDVGISVDGLLKKSDATYTATLAAALDIVAGSAGAASTRGQPSEPCKEVGVHIFVLPVPPRTDASDPPLNTMTDICGGDMSVQILEQPEASCGSATAPAATCATQRLHDGTQARVGVFYRQSRPYTVKVSPINAGRYVEQTVLLPTRSPTRFLPMDRALFANTTAKVVFDDGEPTALVQSATGEGSEMLKLPAKLAQAYFAAVGAVLSGLTRSSTQQAEAAAAQARALAAQQQLALCRAAASARPADPALVEAACRIGTSP